MRFPFCCVPGCYSTKSGELLFFICRARWQPIIREKCGVPDWILPYRSSICERHFEVKYIRKFQLQDADKIITDIVLTKEALPTIFHNDSLSQTPQTPKCDSEEDINDYNDLRISNTSLTNGKTSKISENNGRSILDADILLNRGHISRHSQIGTRLYKTSPMEGEIGEYSDSNISNTTLPKELEAKMSKLPEITVQLISDSDISDRVCPISNRTDSSRLNGEISNTCSPNVTEYEKRDSIHKKHDNHSSNITILNKYSSGAAKSFKGVRRKDKLHRTHNGGGPSRSDSYLLNNEILNIQVCPTTKRPLNETIGNSGNVAFEDQVSDVIKQEIIDDQEVEGIREDCQIEQINCGFTDVKEENMNLNIISEVLATEEEGCIASIPEKFGVNLSDILDINIDMLNKKDQTTVSNSSRLDGDLLNTCPSNETESYETLTRFDSIVSNKLLKKSSSVASKSYITPRKKNRIHNTNTTVGPSRFDSDVLNDDSPPVKWLFEPSHENGDIKGKNENDSFHEQQEVIIKKEIVDDQIEGATRCPQVIIKKEIIDDRMEGTTECPQIEQINGNLTDVKDDIVNINKRRGSSLDEIEIKKEKMDEEAYINDEYLSQNQIIIKNEVHEEVQINTEHWNDDTHTENSSVHPEDDIEDVKDRSDIWEPEAKLWCRKKICLLCDVYVEGTVNEHIAEHHLEGIFISCPYCDRSLNLSPLQKSFQPELKKHIQSFPLNCELCVEQCRSWMDLNIHMNQKHHVKMSNICSICGFKAKSYVLLVEHIFGSHNGHTLVHNCPHCAFATLNIARLQFHIKMKHPVLPPPQVVRKKPSRPKMRGYTFKKMVKKCPCCDFKATYSSTLKKHMNNYHAD